MTNMGINYLNYLETVQSNRNRERETNRSNLAREAEDLRSHMVNEGIASDTLEETKRSNAAKEQETHRANVAKEGQEERKNTIAALKEDKIKAGVDFKGLGISGQVSGASAYALKTDGRQKQFDKAEAARKQAKTEAANNARKLTPEGKAIMSKSYRTQEDAIKALVTLPPEERENFKAVRDRNGSWTFKQNDAIDPKTGKFIW